MSKTFTKYYLLLSCPNDANTFIPAIKDSVERFNMTYGESNDLYIELKHWSLNSFAQSGKTAQHILNEQLVDNCDFCVALFWNRFGTPTDKYDSGTEEEIDLMMQQNKNVFLYHITAPSGTNKAYNAQRKKITDFLKKYKGLYKTVNSTTELQEDLFKGLQSYFISKKDQNLVTSNNNKKSILCVTALNMVANQIRISHTNFQNSSRVKELKNSIIKNITDINKMQFIASNQKENNSQENDSLESAEKYLNKIKEQIGAHTTFNSGIYDSLNKLSLNVKKQEISINSKKLISEFCFNNSISINDNFFDLGDLKCAPSISILRLDENEQQESTNEKLEKEKYNRIINLAKEIEQYNRIMEFFKAIDSFHMISLFVCNNGTTYDEDIDIKLIIEENTIIKPNDIPIPNNSILEEIISNNLPSSLFIDEKTPDVDEYNNYPSIAKIPALISFYDENHTERIKELQRDYKNEIARIFCYDIRKGDEEDFLFFNIPSLKQHTKMFFPSRLFFKNAPKSIKYEINSKHSPKIFTGELIIE